MNFDPLSLLRISYRDVIKLVLYTLFICLRSSFKQEEVHFVFM